MTCLVFKPILSLQLVSIVPCMGLLTLEFQIEQSLSLYNLYVLLFSRDIPVSQLIAF